MSHACRCLVNKAFHGGARRPLGSRRQWARSSHGISTACRGLVNMARLSLTAAPAQSDTRTWSMSGGHISCSWRHGIMPVTAPYDSPTACRVLVDKARVEAQSFRLTLDEQISVDALTRYIAGGLYLHDSCMAGHSWGPNDCFKCVPLIRSLMVMH